MEQTVPNPEQEPVIKGKKSFPKKIIIVGLVVLVIGLGILTGFLLAGRGKVAVAPGGTGVIEESKIVKDAEFGLQEASTFTDTATGVLEAGGIDGEGTHKLLREGGSSQTVYLTSSVLDLDQFEGRKIQIWGETNKAQKAGWLMDVGRIKVLE